MDRLLEIIRYLTGVYYTKEGGGRQGGLVKAINNVDIRCTFTGAVWSVFCRLVSSSFSGH